MTIGEERPGSARAEPDAYKEIQARARSLSAALVEIGKRPLKDPDLVAALDKAAFKIQDATALASSIVALREDVVAFAKSVRERRAAQFGPVLADFVQTQRAAGAVVTEISANEFRVGPIKLEGDAAASRARALYAHQEISGWQSVATRADLEKVLTQAMAALTSVEIEQGQLGAVFQEAYEVIARGALGVDSVSRRVKLVDLRREVHLAVLRRALEKDADRKLAKIVFPSWAFAYNADRYRRIHRELPARQRLSFETGSQQDHKLGLAVPMNGLDPKAEYKAFCYAEPTPTGNSE